MLAHGIIAAVPSIGSLGASGDLIPLAHIVRAMTGEGEVLRGSETIPAMAALAEHGLQPCRLSKRDALALVNGTSFSTAYMALALVRSRRLVIRAEEITGWVMRVLGWAAGETALMLVFMLPKDTQGKKNLRVVSFVEPPWTAYRKTKGDRYKRSTLFAAPLKFLAPREKCWSKARKRPSRN
jgi:hypothetical protein